jgi:hypothetical protein
VSEEKTQTQQEQSPETTSWEAQIQARANELLAQRTNALKAEIERLQSSIVEISARLDEQAQAAPDEQETAGLLDYVKQWFSDSSAKAEEDFQARLDQARREAADAAFEEAERDFQGRLEQARHEWQAGQMSEEVFQRRLETACAEAAAVARREADTQIEDLREQLEASRKALTLAVSSSQSASSQAANFDAIRAAIDEIDAQRTQAETLTALVRRAANFAPRIVFFVVKSGDAVGWKASGFENGLNDETAKLLSVPVQKPTLLREALTTFRVATSDSGAFEGNSAVLGLYASPAAGRSVAIPLVIRNKAAAVLYADSGSQSENSINMAAIESLMRVAGLVIEALPARRGAEPVRQTVPIAQSNATAAAAAPAPEPAIEQRTTQPVIRPEVQPEFQPEVRAEAPKSIEPEVEPPAVPTAEFEPVAAVAEETVVADRITEELPAPAVAAPVAESLHQAEAQSYQPARIEAEPGVVEAAPEAGAEPGYEAPHPEPPAPPPFYAERPIVGEDTASAPTMPMTSFNPPPAEEPQVATSTPVFTTPPPPVFMPPVEPPKPAQPVMSVPTPASETEQRAHNDARRFARLLVSEIKLYNAAKVNDGRRNYDLYDRLKDEIDRSRKVYDKRVSPAVAARFDYFYDELVQTLAEGDPAKLGKNCPGPVVLASN